jgi:hypothetical protein
VPPTTDLPYKTIRRPLLVHHVWMMDVTQIRAFLGGTLYLASVFDAFSRVPLPAGAFLGIEAQTAASPPRAPRGEGPQETPFTIGFLYPDCRTFPILKKTAPSERSRSVAAARTAAPQTFVRGTYVATGPVTEKSDSPRKKPGTATSHSGEPSPAPVAGLPALGIRRYFHSR